MRGLESHLQLDMDFNIRSIRFNKEIVCLKLSRASLT